MILPAVAGQDVIHEYDLRSLVIHTPIFLKPLGVY